MATSELAWFRAELNAFAAALKKHKATKLVRFENQKPRRSSPEAWDLEQGPCPPAQVFELAADVGDVDLEWSWPERRVSGALSVRASAALKAEGEASPMEGRLSWFPVPSTDAACVVFSTDEAGGPEGRIDVVDLDGMVVSEDLSTGVVLRALLDRLGIAGWNLSLKDQPSEEELEALAECEASARAVRAALGLAVPDALLNED